MEKIIDSLQLIHLRVKSGETLTSSLRDMGEGTAPPSVTYAWMRIRDSILSGQFPAESSLASFIQNLKIQNRLKKKLQKCSTLPKLQLIAISIMSALYLFSSIFIFPDNLRPSAGIITTTTLLLGTAMLSMKELLGGFNKRLSFSSWIEFLCFLESSLGAGSTLAHALKEYFSLNKKPPWPPSLLKKIDDFRNSLSSNPNSSNSVSIQSQSKDFTIAHEHFHFIKKAFSEGRPLKELLRNFIDSATERFEQNLDYEMERLNLLLLLPLFCFVVPAILILIFGPLLAML